MRHTRVLISLVPRASLTTTPRVVTGLWFSIEATFRPLLRVETFRGSALTSSRSDLATAAWAANCRLAVLWTAGDFTIREAMAVVLWPDTDKPKYNYHKLKM